MIIPRKDEEQLMVLQGSSQELSNLLDEMYDAAEAANDEDGNFDDLVDLIDKARDAAQGAADAAGEVMYRIDSDDIVVTGRGGMGAKSLSRRPEPDELLALRIAAVDDCQCNGEGCCVCQSSAVQGLSTSNTMSAAIPSWNPMSAAILSFLSDKKEPVIIDARHFHDEATALAERGLVTAHGNSRFSSCKPDVEDK